MVLTVHISKTIRGVVKDLPETVTIKRPAPTAIRKLAVEIGIPPILIVFTMVNGVKQGLDDMITSDAEIHFVGTMAGG